MDTARDQYTGWGKAGVQSYVQPSVYSCRCSNCCVIFHMRQCNPTLAHPAYQVCYKLYYSSSVHPNYVLAHFNIPFLWIHGSLTDPVCFDCQQYHFLYRYTFKSIVTPGRQEPFSQVGCLALCSSQH